MTDHNPTEAIKTIRDKALWTISEYIKDAIETSDIENDADVEGCTTEIPVSDLRVIEAALNTLETSIGGRTLAASEIAEMIAWCNSAELVVLDPDGRRCIVQSMDKSKYDHVEYHSRMLTNICDFVASKAASVEPPQTMRSAESWVKQIVADEENLLLVDFIHTIQQDALNSAVPQWQTIESAPTGSDDYFLVGCSDINDKRSPFVVRGDLLENARKPNTPKHLSLSYLTHLDAVPHSAEREE